MTTTRDLLIDFQHGTHNILGRTAAQEKGRTAGNRTRTRDQREGNQGGDPGSHQETPRRQSPSWRQSCILGLVWQAETKCAASPCLLVRRLLSLSAFLTRCQSFRSVVHFRINSRCGSQEDGRASQDRQPCSHSRKSSFCCAGCRA